MSYIRTYTGKEFYPLKPELDKIDIEDIAHALSNLCRFTGHTKQFYSVAQHSVLASEFVRVYDNPHLNLFVLLHDASEAYICDISRPLKVQECFKPYLQYEKILQNQIYLNYLGRL